MGVSVRSVWRKIVCFCRLMRTYDAIGGGSDVPCDEAEGATGGRGAWMGLATMEPIRRGIGPRWTRTLASILPNASSYLSSNHDSDSAESDYPYISLCLPGPIHGGENTGEVWGKIR